jgi:putative transposase
MPPRLPCVGRDGDARTALRSPSARPRLCPPPKNSLGKAVETRVRCNNIALIKMGVARRDVPGHKVRRRRRTVPKPRVGAPAQLVLSFPSAWGGRRPGAGRRPAHGRSSPVPHRQRPLHSARHPVHVTLRVAGVPSLREQVMFRAVRSALVRGTKPAFRLIHYSVQSNHIHLIVESTAKDSLSRGVQGLSVRIARSVNQALARRGPVFSERYHSRALETPRETWFALRYVLFNFRRHSRTNVALDPCSSAIWFDGFKERLPAAQGPPVVAPPRTWLARRGWRRHGLLSAFDSPGDATHPSTARR